MAWRSIENSVPFTTADLPYGTVAVDRVPAGTFCFAALRLAAARRFRTWLMHLRECRHLMDTFLALRCFAFGATTPAAIWVLERNGALSTSTPPSRRRLDTVSLPATSRALAWNS